MNAKHQEFFAKHEENLRVIQNLEDNLQDLKNDNAVLNRKVSEWKLKTSMYGKCKNELNLTFDLRDYCCMYSYHLL